MTTAAPKAPARRKYLCKLLDNPLNVFTGIASGVTLSRFKEKLEFQEVEDKQRGVTYKKHTGKRWYEEPVYELDVAVAENFVNRLDFMVLRPGSGIVELDRNWGPAKPDGTPMNPDEQGSLSGRPVVAGMADGDLPLKDFIDFRAWTGSTESELEALAAENEKLRKRLEALEAQAAEDDAEEQAAKSDAVTGDREPGPRRRRKPSK